MSRNPNVELGTLEELRAASRDLVRAERKRDEAMLRARLAGNSLRVIALKTGRSEQGAKVAMSHTSSLAGADTLYDALFERYGIARMTS